MLFDDPFTDSSDDEVRDEMVGDCRAAFDDSDVEIDETEVPLKHAGAYTPEEITLITRDKLIQLQSLYAEYLNILKRRYGRKRVEFIKRIKTERDTTGPIVSEAVTPKQKMKLEQLAAWRRYHRHFGEEGLLHQQSLKRRRLAVGLRNANDNESIHLCNALVNGMDCGEVALPNSSMCAKHILCDGKQVLFFKCEVEECRNVCFPISDIRFCWIHQRLEGIKYDWTAINNATNISLQQRASIFSQSTPQLRIFPPLSTSGAFGDQISPSSAEKSPTISSSGTVKRGGFIRGRGRGRGRPIMGAQPEKIMPARIVGHAQQPLENRELRNPPLLISRKTPSYDEVSAEAGVYGAYMASTEQSAGSIGLVKEEETNASCIKMDSTTMPASSRASL